jgi:hypothetical protein
VAKNLTLIYIRNKNLTLIYIRNKNLTLIYIRNKNLTLIYIRNKNLPVTYTACILILTNATANNITGRDSSVGIATGYGLDGPGIGSRWGARFLLHVQTGPRAHPAYCTMGTGSFPGVKRPGPGADHPPLSSAEVTNE